jgi:hypothetical protein
MRVNWLWAPLSCSNEAAWSSEGAHAGWLYRLAAGSRYAQNLWDLTVSAYAYASRVFRFRIRAAKNSKNLAAAFFAGVGENRRNGVSVAKG